MSARETRLQRRTLTYRQPVVTSHGSIDRRDVLVLSVADAEARWGHGEASPLPGFGPDTLDDAEAALRSWAQGDDRALDSSPSAAAAVDSAQLDLAAQAAGVPMHSHLASGSPDSIPVAALVIGAGTGELGSATALAVASGHRTVKVKVGGRPIADDRERVRAVRDTAGHQVAIRLDANGAWSVDEAVEALQGLASLSIELVEEPAAGGPEALERVAARTGIPVAADESTTHPDRFAELLRSRSVGAVVVKPSAIGGPTEAARRITMAREAGLAVVVTSMLEGAIGVAAAAHLASATAAIDPEPGLATSPLIRDDVGPAHRVSKGRLWLSDTPGLGTGPFLTP
jgi:o-succinylbenzoate synthase